MENIFQTVIDLGLEKSLIHYLGEPTARLTQAVILLVVSILIYYISNRYFLELLNRLILKSKIKWDDLLIKHKVINRFIKIIPFIFIQYFAHIFPSFQGWIEKICMSVIVFLIIRTISAFLKCVVDLYRTTDYSNRRPIKGYIQILNIIVYSVGLLSIVAIVLEKDLTKIFAGLGALTAVLILVFKDTILGLVASIQITSNNLIKMGDWVEVPKYGADGDVIDIGLHTVKIQNWDKTITSVPTYSLISDSFKNWRGMSESGGRRIKRSLNIDMTSIHFCSEELFGKLSKIQLLKTYLEGRTEEINKYNEDNLADKSSLVNGRHLTNVGIFRQYIECYLENNKILHKGMTFLVRHLAPGPQGLPIEIYVFSSDQEWKNYEILQADIFDHILAAVSEFELKVFQEPSGEDFRSLKN